MNMYEVSVPVFLRGLNNLRDVLKKGEAFASAQGRDADELLQVKLAEDMFPLVRQVQIACDAAKNGSARLAGVELPSHPDTEASFDELYARIEKVESFVKGLDKAAFDDAAQRDIRFEIKGKPHAFKGQEYLTQFVVPNFYFHITTAYGLLRKEGVQLGKNDYLGRA